MNGNSYGDYNNLNDIVNTDQNVNTSFDNNATTNMTMQDNNYGYDINQNYYTGNNYVNKNDVLFESNNLSTPQEKLKYFFNAINKKALTVIIASILGVLLLVLFIVFILNRYNASYNSKVSIPKVVYMGESDEISVIASGKRNIDKTETTFKTSNENILFVVDSKLTGKNVSTTIVPISEGKSTIEVLSKLGRKKMASSKVEVTVCPAFNSSLIVNDHIAIVKGASERLNIDFGDEVCKTGITYETSNPAVMTIDKDGVIRAVDTGTAVLSIKKDNRVLTIPIVVSASSVAIESFDVSPSIIQLEQGQMLRLGVKINPSNANSLNTRYSGYDPTIISVSDGGVVKALKSGTTTLKVSPGFSSAKEIPVIVGKDDSVNATLVTAIEFDKSDFNLIEGTSSKIYALFVPNNVNDKTITWETSNEEVAVVKNGIVYGRSAGTASIMAKAKNDISKAINVTVKEVEMPIIETSDKIESEKWHTNTYSLSFHSPLSSVIYKYGVREDAINKVASNIVISKNEQNTYYIVACINNHCSRPAKYVSNVDIEKPKVVAVAGISKTTTKENSLKIALEDSFSKVDKWCVTTTDQSITCKWHDTEKIKKPVVDYKIDKNGVYYVFAKDVAGNVSDFYKFEITNIG